MEDGVVVVPRAGVGDEIFDGAGGGFREEAEMDVAVSGVQDCGGAGFVGFCFFLLSLVQIAGFFVLHVTRRFGDVGFICEDIEADLAAGGAHKHGIAGFGFLKQGVGGGGHGGGDDGFLLGGALVEGEIERAEGLVFTVDFDDAVGVGVEDFGAEEGAIEDEVGGFVEDDVDFVGNGGVFEFSFDG